MAVNDFVVFMNVHLISLKKGGMPPFLSLNWILKRLIFVPASQST